MKILIINSSDIQGGAARAAYRLHKALRNEGIDSNMLVQVKLSDDYTVLGPKSKINRLFGKIRPHLDSIPVRRYKSKSKTLFSPSWVPFSGIVERINEISPDIVHLHWNNGGMMTIKDIAKIKVPIVWSLHDMWAFTGGCHYTEECDKYKNTCGKCKVLNSGKLNDLSANVYKKKSKHLSALTNIHFIGLSKWMKESILESSLFCNKQVFNIPNPIDTRLFSPIDKSTARELLNLPKDQKIVLFGAMNATSDPRKGFNELSVSLDILEDTNIELVIFGSNQPQNPPQFKFKSHYLGLINDDISLKILYNAVDVMVVPSLQENLSNAIMESLSCGTPVVAFNVGGNSDMIEHLTNGYLAQPFDCNDMAKGINWIIYNHNIDELKINARKKIMEEFDSKLVAKRYIDLYEGILNATPKVKS